MTLKGIKIVSNGNAYGGTKVYDAEGRDITSVMRIRKVTWEHNAGEVPVAHITCNLAEIEATVPETMCSVEANPADTTELHDIT